MVDQEQADGTGGDVASGRIARARHSAEERISWARRTVDHVTHRVEEIRPDTPLVDTAYEVYERDSSIAGGLLAGAMAFRLFLIAVPMLLILVAGLGFLHVSGNEQGTATTLDFSDQIVETMQSVGENAARGRWITLGVGLVAVVLAMRTMIKSLRVVHHLAWRIPARARSAKPLAVLAGVGVLAAVVAYTAFGQWLRGHTPGGGVSVSIAIGAGTGVLWYFVQQLLPRSEGAPWTSLLPGAVLMAVATQAIHAATVFYLAGRIQRMSDTYGPLGVAIVVLLWLYLLGRSMVAAAVLNATLWDRRSRGARSYAPLDPSVLRTFRLPVQAADPADDRPTGEPPR